ncbi:MAG: LPS export ABC transporter ATP-binding protein [Rickettsiales bacterium]|jgi:lipopolysaccharide export system ATP-binding protein|nr:LPS export ABC transporter ATP-binding protein [Rickettsiales bacterium]MBV31097.1 LPS export ABC transporter ATP-binding protein [Rickettsiales bacterium]PPR39988.1 MAG: Lipopolysaccharide export system ATP-binding protein LptB [Alphaproteobacteria bacterium MarineAlpha7_Bin1]|tara:strand:- start:207 stop:965 length:759 start_codon:yes stop_codon:yes gene_type:complete
MKEQIDTNLELVSNDTGLVIKNIGKNYGKRPILRDISLEVKKGEAVAILGPNGAGKTTTFHIITGLLFADYGEVLLDGHDLTLLPMYRRARLGVGYLPQEASVFRGLSVEQNILSILEISEKLKTKRKAKLETLLGEFEISHLRKASVQTLSGGERRRVEIARCLASNPTYILLDEPLAGIDPKSVLDIAKLIKNLKDRGIGLLITDHNARDTLDIVDRAYILNEGKILKEGIPSEIKADPRVRLAYLGENF